MVTVLQLKERFYIYITFIARFRIKTKSFVLHRSKTREFSSDDKTNFNDEKNDGDHDTG